MARQNFDRMVAKWCLASERRILAVRNESIERLAELVQTPVGAGGRMPVVTGFLRASFASAVGNVPSIAKTADTLVGRFGVASTHGGWSGQPLSITLAQAGPEDGITLGWGAHYARYAEHHHGFMDLGLARWPQIVQQVAREAFSRNAR
jgi:hypothetical protein